MLIQDLTIFMDDDVTPLLGSVDGAGNVVVASFSTDPAHPRSHLKFAENVGESEVRFWDGDSTLGQLTIELIDVPTVAWDQDSGQVTALLAAAAGLGLGNTQLLGRRFLVRQSEDGVTFSTLLDGVPTDVKMTDAIASYRIAMRDIRERERMVRAFVKADTTMIFPAVGPKDGFGTMTRYDENGVASGYTKLIPAPAGIDATWRAMAPQGNGDVWGWFELAPSDALADLTEKYRAIWDRHGVIDERVYAGDQFSVFPNNVASEWKAARVEWTRSAYSLTAPPVWTVAPVVPLVSSISGNLTGNAFEYQDRRVSDGSMRTMVFRVYAFLKAGTIPNANEVVKLRLVSQLPPTEETPYYLEEASYGHLLEKAYTGAYSDPEMPPRVRFDQAQVDLMKAKTPRVLGIISEPAKDLRKWLAESAYKISGWAPATRNGVVFPIQYKLPDATMPLVTFTNANTQEGASWGHGTGTMVNRVTVKYKRVSAPSAQDTDRSPVVQEAEYTDESNFSAALGVGVKELVFEPDTACSIMQSGEGVGLSGDSSLELGLLLGRARAFDVIDRFSLGAQEIVLMASTDDPAIKAAREGDWCVIGLSWLPDYQTGRRGMSRLGQITKIGKTNATWREFTIVDAGPHAQPVGLPVVNGLAANADGSVSVSVVTMPVNAGAVPEVEVQFAVGAVVPADDGGWEVGGLAQTVGTLTSRAFPGGSRVWMRYRGSAEGRRRSAWSAPASIVVPVRATLEQFRLDVVNGVPRLRFVAYESTAGVRIRYARHAAGTAQPLPAALVTTIDVAASTLPQVVMLPITLNQLEQVSVQLEAWSGFAAGAVAGTKGQTSLVLTAVRMEGEPALPRVTETRTSTGGGGVVTLGLAIDDPQGRVTLVEFATRSGDAGTFSAYAADTAPYSASTVLPLDESSAIRYRVTGYDATGALVVLNEAEVTYQDTLSGFVNVTTQLMSATATTETWRVSAIKPDGTHGTVAVIGVTGSATLNGPDVVGTQYASPHDFVFTRGAPTGPNGAAQVRGYASGWLSDDDAITVPAQGRDTVPLVTKLIPAANTVTTQPVNLLVTDALADIGPGTAVVTFTGIPSVVIGGVARASGYSFAVVPGTQVLITPTRGDFGTGMGRLQVVVTKAGRVEDSDSVDVAPQDRDTIMPFLRAVASENGATGLLRLTPVDPQARITKVETATVAANATSAPVYAVVAAVGGVYDTTITLLEKQPVQVLWRLSAITVAGFEQVVQEGSVRFALGALPLTPVLKYYFGSDGTLTVTVVGDSDTNLLHIVVRTDAQPTMSDVDAAVGATNEFVGRSAAYTHPTKLTPGQRFYAAARAYNTTLSGTLAAKGSIAMDSQSDQWNPEAAQATVTPGFGSVAVGIDSRSVTVSSIQLGPQASEVRAFAREFRTDPGAAVDVSKTGYPIPGTPLRASGAALLVPVANPGNWFIVTLQALDKQGQVGQGVVSWDGVTMPPPAAGTVNIKVRSTLVAQPAPNAPTALVLSQVGTDGVNLAVTMPGTNLPTILRVVRDGVPIADVGRSVLAGAVQNIVDTGRSPGTAYSYRVYGVNAAGVQELVGSPAQSITLTVVTLDAPTLSLGAYSISGQGLQMTVTPGANNPSGTTYLIEGRRTTHDGAGNPTGTSAWSQIDSQIALSFWEAIGNNTINYTTWDFRATATKAGYTASAVSAVVSRNVPNSIGAGPP